MTSTLDSSNTPGGQAVHRRRLVRRNDLLRRARLSLRSPSGFDVPMSRQELAEAANAYLAGRGVTGLAPVVVVLGAAAQSKLSHTGQCAGAGRSMTAAGTGSRLGAKVDPLALGLAHGPYPAYARLRRAGALVPAGPGTYAVGRHHEVGQLLREPRLSHRFPDSYRQFTVGAGLTSQLLQRIVSSQEPPEHPAVRGWLQAALTGAESDAWWRWARQQVDETVAALAGQGRFDAVGELATPLAVSLACRLYGLDSEAQPVVAALAPALGRALTALRLSETDQQAADAAVRRARSVFAAAAEPAGDRTGPGLLARLAGDASPAAAAVDNAVFLCFTAIEMLNSAIATCLAVLLAHPAQLALLRADPAIVDTAVAELLRFDSPTQGTARRVTVRLEVAGQPVRPGRVLLLLLGSANHDERVFNDPARLDLTRRDNPHLSFGDGPYRCLGAQLATRVCATVLLRLLARTTRLEPAAPPTRQPPATFCRSYATVPVFAEAA